MVISCSTSIATVDDLPPLPPLCNVHTGRRCKMTNGLLHPSVTVFALQSREKTLLADSKSRAFGSHRKSSKHNHLRHPPQDHAPHGHAYVPRATKSELCTKEAATYHRPHCLHEGSYYESAGGALRTNATGFFSYTRGRWEREYVTVDSKRDKNHDLSHGFRYHLDVPGCDLKAFSADFFCVTMHALAAAQRDWQRSGSAGGSARREAGSPYIVFVGDSLVGGQFGSLWSSTVLLRGAPGEVMHAANSTHEACGVRTRSWRTDRLKQTVKHSGAPDSWVEEVCFKATVAVVNTGAHASGQDGFEADFRAALDRLLEVCGEGIRRGVPTVFFRTTAEGNPWCNTVGHVPPPSMDAWDEDTWLVLTGDRPAPPDKLFNPAWHWREFQSYNRYARLALEGTGIRLLDVVPMTRLRPTDDWGQTDFRGKPIDCLHGNGAAHEWNTLIINSIAALVCERPKELPVYPG